MDDSSLVSVFNSECVLLLRFDHARYSARPPFCESAVPRCGVLMACVGQEQRRSRSGRRSA